MPPTLETMDSDIFHDIYDHLCADYSRGNRPYMLKPLSLVSRAIRQKIVPLLFHRIYWRTQIHHRFLGVHLLGHARILRIIATTPLEFTESDEDSLVLSFSQMEFIETVKIEGLWGPSWLMTKLLAAMPALKTLEYVDPQFANPSVDFRELSGIRHLTYRSYREVKIHPDFMQFMFNESGRLSNLIAASAPTLLHIEMPGQRMRFDLLSNHDYPSLRTLVLTGSAPVFSVATPLFAVLMKCPGLQTLEVRFNDRGGQFEIFPNFSSSIQTREQLLDVMPRLQSLTLYNPSDIDGVLSVLPRSLRFLSLAQHPYPLEIDNNLDLLRRVIFCTPVTSAEGDYYNWPSLRAVEILPLLQQSGAEYLRELRLAVKGPISLEWLASLSRAFPRLEVFEFHHWPTEMDEQCRDLAHYCPGLSSFSYIRELRLDMHLRDEVEFNMDNDAQDLRAQKVAERMPCVETIGFMQGHGGLNDRGPGIGTTLWWQKYDVIRDPNSDQPVLARAQHRTVFHPYESNNY